MIITHIGGRVRTQGYKKQCIWHNENVCTEAQMLNQMHSNINVTDYGGQAIGEELRYL